MSVIARTAGMIDGQKAEVSTASTSIGCYETTIFVEENGRWETFFGLGGRQYHSREEALTGHEEICQNKLD